MQEYKDLRFVDYQNEAENVLRRVGVDETSPLPIDAEFVANSLGFDIVPIKNLKKDYGIKGMVFSRNCQFYIGVDENHYLNEEESCLFTIGEELGHIILHHDSQDNELSVEDLKQWLRKKDPNHKNREQQARMFSSNLILPYFIFNDYVLKFIEESYSSVTRCNFRNDPDIFCDHIADYLKDSLGISEYILSKALRRFPVRAIDRIYKQFPELKRAPERRTVIKKNQL